MSYEPHPVGSWTKKLPGRYRTTEFNVRGVGDIPTVIVPGTGRTPSKYAGLLNALVAREPNRQFITPFTAGSGNSTGLSGRETHVQRLNETLEVLGIPDDANVVIIGHSSGGVFATQSAGMSKHRRGISVAGPVFNHPDALALGFGLAANDIMNEFDGYMSDLSKNNLFAAGSAMGARMFNTIMNYSNPFAASDASAMDGHLRRLPIEPRVKLFLENRGLAVYGASDLAIRPPSGNVPEHWIDIIDGNHTTILDTNTGRRADYLSGAIDRVCAAPLLHTIIAAA